ncbi:MULTISPECIES: ABC transporter permease [Mesoflavibacter]|jgi:ABC-2 type transport system permease protein|uniref:ABC transporter permease n=1 Tax=Mesoflavibacter zeaxanthinifaciens subsp. sabulilitoris TaxID=1520893 RepID=A0A2T1NAM3_9FLAO|nr:MULTISPECIES: ABC transporter permease [Mesoflavibacter]MBB3123675.1 ABC-2 type transport system permease protein [Mesoflavibacter zeaxanthinifaciens subsp. sabulilitoris]MCP4053525.1 ABC transporter permease [Mesoflavibacter sp.]PSG89201.1 ABC transporter permease [Mesoflavibacter zeaxanthinifaciens subsp. sabulilitoris]UAB74581.1 ABC transporter permease [Mesoflavibacter sp. SCSIO 43206]
MNHLPLIIKREYLNKVKNKAFLIMTILSPLIFIALIAVVAYLSQLNNDSQRQISVLDESGYLTGVFKDSESIKYNILTDKNLENAKQIVKEADNYGLLHIKKMNSLSEAKNSVEFYSEETPSLSLISDLEKLIEIELTHKNLAEKNIDTKLIDDSKINIDITQENFSGEKTSKFDSVVKLAFGGAAGYLLFMFIIIYGNMIMRSVIEEKTSRIIEVIISSVKPIQLMLGKIIGTSLAGITQFVIWLILGGVLMVVVTAIFGIDMTQIQSPQQQMMQQAMTDPDAAEKAQIIFSAFFNLPLANLIIAFLLFFISGYLLYSSLYAAIGAAVDNETDTQQFMLPILMPLILAVYVGMFTVIEDPHGTVSTVFSFIPFTSPVVMLMRIPFGVPLWQQIVSLLLLVGTFLFTVWFAAKIYRVGILMYGKKPSYKELIKWIKY